MSERTVYDDVIEVLRANGVDDDGRLAHRLLLALDEHAVALYVDDPDKPTRAAPVVVDLVGSNSTRGAGEYDKLERAAQLAQELEGKLSELQKWRSRMINQRSGNAIDAVPRLHRALTAIMADMGKPSRGPGRSRKPENESAIRMLGELQDAEIQGLSKRAHIVADVLDVLGKNHLASRDKLRKHLIQVFRDLDN